jgi:SHS2 domain-containing protein
MGRIETFEHTADLGLKIFAEDLDELFRTAAEGLFDVIVDNREAVMPVTCETVTLAAESAPDLLLLWLGELIYLCETKHALYAEFDVRLSKSGERLEATIRGEPIDPARHVLDHEVKAVTRHGLEVTKTADGWSACVILDI